jgi:hypothetical protein
LVIWYIHFTPFWCIVSRKNLATLESNGFVCMYWKYYFRAWLMFRENRWQKVEIERKLIKVKPRKENAWRKRIFHQRECRQAEPSTYVCTYMGVRCTYSKDHAIIHTQVLSSTVRSDLKIIKSWVSDPLCLSSSLAHHFV